MLLSRLFLDLLSLIPINDFVSVRLGERNGEIATCEALCVEPSDCCFSFFLATHFYEGKAFFAPCFSIEGHAARHYSAIARENLSELFFGELERDITDEQFVFHHFHRTVDLWHYIATGRIESKHIKET